MLPSCVARGSAETEARFQQGPLFPLGNVTRGCSSGSPVIVRSDPDEDGVALVNRIRREYPRESELVYLDPNADFNSIDLRPYFCEDEIHRQGSSMLRWVLLRISSINSIRMHQIRSLGWAWKETNAGVFWNANWFTAQLLRKYGMEEGDGEILEPVASLLNNLRLFFHSQGIFNAEQEAHVKVPPVSESKTTAVTDTTRDRDGKVHFDDKIPQSRPASMSELSTTTLDFLPPIGGGHTAKSTPPLAMKSMERQDLPPRANTCLAPSEAKGMFSATSGLPQKGMKSNLGARQHSIDKSSNYRKETRNRRNSYTVGAPQNTTTLNQISDDAILAVGQVVPVTSKTQISRSVGKNRRNSFQQTKLLTTAQSQHPQIGHIFNYVANPPSSHGYNIVQNSMLASGGFHADSIMPVLVPPTYPLAPAFIPQPAAFAPTIHWSYNHSHCLPATNLILNLASEPNGPFPPGRAIVSSVSGPTKSDASRSKIPLAKTFTDDARCLPPEDEIRRTRSVGSAAGVGGARWRAHSRQHSKSSNDFGTRPFPHRVCGIPNYDFPMPDKTRPRSWIETSERRSVEAPSEKKHRRNQSIGDELYRENTSNEALLEFRGWCHDASAFRKQHNSGEGDNDRTFLQSGSKHQKKRSSSSSQQRPNNPRRNLSRLFAFNRLEDPSALCKKLSEMKGHLETKSSRTLQRINYFSTFIDEKHAADAQTILHSMVKSADKLVEFVDYAYHCSHDETNHNLRNYIEQVELKQQVVKQPTFPNVEPHHIGKSKHGNTRLRQPSTHSKRVEKSQRPAAMSAADGLPVENSRENDVVNSTSFGNERQGSILVAEVRTQKQDSMTSSILYDQQVVDHAWSKSSDSPSKLMKYTRSSSTNDENVSPDINPKPKDSLLSREEDGSTIATLDSGHAVFKASILHPHMDSDGWHSSSNPHLQGENRPKADGLDSKQIRDQSKLPVSPVQVTGPQFAGSGRSDALLPKWKGPKSGKKRLSAEAQSTKSGSSNHAVSQARQMKSTASLKSDLKLDEANFPTLAEAVKLPPHKNAARDHGVAEQKPWKPSKNSKAIMKGSDASLATATLAEVLRSRSGSQHKPESLLWDKVNQDPLTESALETVSNDWCGSNTDACLKLDGSHEAEENKSSYVSQTDILDTRDSQTTYSPGFVENIDNSSATDLENADHGKSAVDEDITIQFSIPKNQGDATTQSEEEPTCLAGVTKCEDVPKHPAYERPEMQNVNVTFIEQNLDYVYGEKLLPYNEDHDEQQTAIETDSFELSQDEPLLESVARKRSGQVKNSPTKSSRQLSSFPMLERRFQGAGTQATQDTKLVSQLEGGLASARVEATVLPIVTHKKKKKKSSLQQDGLVPGLLFQTKEADNIFGSLHIDSAAVELNEHIERDNSTPEKLDEKDTSVDIPTQNTDAPSDTRPAIAGRTSEQTGMAPVSSGARNLTPPLTPPRQKAQPRPGQGRGRKKKTIRVQNGPFQDKGSQESDAHERIFSTDALKGQRPSTYSFKNPGITEILGHGTVPILSKNSIASEDLKGDRRPLVSLKSGVGVVSANFLWAEEKKEQEQHAILDYLKLGDQQRNNRKASHMQVNLVMASGQTRELNNGVDGKFTRRGPITFFEGSSKKHPSLSLREVAEADKDREETKVNARPKPTPLRLPRLGAFRHYPVLPTRVTPSTRSISLPLVGTVSPYDSDDAFSSSSETIVGTPPPQTPSTGGSECWHDASEEPRLSPGIESVQDQRNSSDVENSKGYDGGAHDDLIICQRTPSERGSSAEVP